MDGQPHRIGDLNDDCTAHWGNLMLRAGLLEAICVYPIPSGPVSGAPAAWSPRLLSFSLRHRPIWEWAYPGPLICCRRHC